MRHEIKFIQLFYCDSYLALHSKKISTVFSFSKRKKVPQIQGNHDLDPDDDPSSNNHVLAIWHRQLLFTNPNLDRFEEAQLKMNGIQFRQNCRCVWTKKLWCIKRRGEADATGLFSIILKLKQAWNYFRLKPHVMTLTFSNLQIDVVESSFQKPTVYLYF